MIYDIYIIILLGGLNYVNLHNSVIYKCESYQQLLLLYFCKKNLLYKNNFYIFVKITDYEGEIGVFAKK